MILAAWPKEFTFEFKSIFGLGIELQVIFLVGYGIHKLMPKIKLPRLLGYIVLGIVLNMIVGATKWNGGTSHLAQFFEIISKLAIAILVLKAGLAIDFKTIKKVGSRTILLGFIPALAEGFAVFAFAFWVMGWPFGSASTLAFVISAVSPAVTVGLLLKFKKEGYSKQVTTMGAVSGAIDDVFALSMFTMFFGLAQAELGVSKVTTDIITELWHVPVEMILGVGVGILFGVGINILMDKVHIKAKLKPIIIFVVAMLLIFSKDIFPAILTLPVWFSDVMAVMAFGLTLRETAREKEEIEIDEYVASKAWDTISIPLFVLVGSYIVFATMGGILLAGLAILFLGVGARMFATYAIIDSSPYTKREKGYLVLSQIPKATVQAALGGLPLIVFGKGFLHSEEIMAIATLAIVVTAPLGAIIMEKLGPKLLIEKADEIDWAAERIKKLHEKQGASH